jgi:hypothetical protein
VLHRFGLGAGDSEWDHLLMNLDGVRKRIELIHS